MLTRYTVRPIAHPYLPPVPRARGRVISVLYTLAIPLPARDSPELCAYSEPVYFGPSGRLSPITSARAENDFKVFIWISGKIILYPARSMGELKMKERLTRSAAAGKKENNRRRPVAGVPLFAFALVLLLRRAVPLVGAGVLLVECLDELRHFIDHRARGGKIADGKRLDR